ncbi:hypothetical protein [Desulfocastanea catecholica]
MNSPLKKSCAVALPRERNSATFTQKTATAGATNTQPTGLKALACRVLERNKERNSPATTPKTDRNFSPATKAVAATIQKSCAVAFTRERNSATPKNEHLQAISDNDDDIMAAISPRLPGRTWAPGNPYTCKCGDVTGWTLAGQALCPLCYHEKYHGPDDQADRPGKTAVQILCKASSLIGIIAATDGRFCKDWQDHFCIGCELYKPQINILKTITQ